MKKAFSLIEIMQTVVLLGIIAGLSISFFKRFSSNYKLYNATTKQLKLAIQEANRKMCSDTTPYCTDLGISWEEANNNDAFLNSTCEEVYGNTVHFDTTRARCEVNTAGNCPDIKSGYAAKEYVPQMVKDSSGVCYAYPTCIIKQSVENGGVSTTEYQPKSTQPYSELVCTGGKPDYSNTKEGVSVLCWYLHDILAHKQQGLDNNEDLRRTCITNKNVIAYNNITYNAASPELTAEKVQGIVDNEATNALTSYNMLLPNGVRLYNIGGAFTKGSQIFIYIKYDKSPDIKTSVFVQNNPENSTVGVLKVNNPTTAP